MKKIKLLSDVYILSLVIFSFSISEITLIAMTIYCCLSPNDHEGLWYCLPLFLYILVLYLCLLPKWIAIIELNEQGIALRVPYKSLKKKPYDHYNHVYYGTYMQGPTMRSFLVLSKEFISEEKLLQVNLLNNSEDLIKIKLSPKRCEQLLEILPEYHRSKLKQIIKENLSDFPKKEARKKKKLQFIYDKKLFAIWLTISILCVASAVAVFVSTLLTVNPESTDSVKNLAEIFVRIACMVVALVPYVTLSLIKILKLDEEGATFIQPLKRKMKISYETLQVNILMVKQYSKMTAQKVP